MTRRASTQVTGSKTSDVLPVLYQPYLNFPATYIPLAQYVALSFVVHIIMPVKVFSQSLIVHWITICCVVAADHGCEHDNPLYAQVDYIHVFLAHK